MIFVLNPYILANFGDFGKENQAIFGLAWNKELALLAVEVGTSCVIEKFRTKTCASDANSIQLSHLSNPTYMNFNRAIEPLIEKQLFKGKIIIIYGARQVGKTTLSKDLLKKHQIGGSLYLNCDEPDIKQSLENKTSTELKQIIGDKKLIVIDEAQRVRDIGITLKLLVDNFPEIQIIATGSSSFDLSNHISEPLTGRSIEFRLYPISLLELKQQYSEIELSRLFERFLRFGNYPKVINSSPVEAPEIISAIAQNYLYKDILAFEKLKNPEILQKLLQALALQLGQEVSYTELANLLKINKITVEKYIQILEKSFVIFRLNPFSRNLRKEISKMRKIYFYDLGIRNSLIKNFNELALRTDVGAMWENFCIAERAKANTFNRKLVNTYFWRTQDQKEIDYLEEEGGKLKAFEFKWGEKKYKIPKEFIAAYPGTDIKVINKANIWELI
jgi:hypothetical protein